MSNLALDLGRFNHPTHAVCGSIRVREKLVPVEEPEVEDGCAQRFYFFSG